MNPTREQNPDPGSKQLGQDVEQAGQQQLQRQQIPGQGDSQNQSGSQQGDPSDGRGQRGSQGDPRESRKQQDQAGGTQRQDLSPATPDEDADRKRKNQRQGNEEAEDRNAQTSGKDVG